MDRYSMCGYPKESQKASLCVSCHVGQLEREGEEISARAEQEMEDAHASHEESQEDPLDDDRIVSAADMEEWDDMAYDQEPS